MQRILIAVLDGGGDLSGPMARAKELEASLASSATPFEIDVVRAAPSVAFAFLEHRPDLIVAVGYAAGDLLPLGQLACPVLWDMHDISEAEMAGWLAEESSRQTLRAALATAQGFVDIPETVALQIEDELKLGITSHGLSAAIAAVAKRVVVIIGAGLGNMIYAGSMLRWLSEKMRVPLDLVIHNRFDDAVSLFARAPWLKAVYPGFEYLTGRRYDLMVSAITAGALQPPFTADRTLRINQERDYNIEGRFIHETRLNFLGLEQLFDEDPTLLLELPALFIRDIAYHYPEDRVIGVANGKKAAAWAKREWPHMEELVARLKDEGWELRSFGLPDEYVPGAQDLTGLPMREVLDEIAKCSFFIGHDGGICHMAEAVGVPTIWLFGPTGSVKNGPFYGHSRALLSMRACGPCLYKADWLRCNQPACMQDITVEQVVQALSILHAELQENGYTAPRAPDNTDLLRYEVDALLRPGPQTQQENSLRERTSFVSFSAAVMEKLTLKLLQKGDLAGAATMADSLRLYFPDSLVGVALSAVVTQVFPAPTMARDLAGEPPAELKCSDFPALVEATAALDLSVSERRALLQAVARYFLQKYDKTSVAQFLNAAVGCKPFAAGLLDSIQKIAAILTLPNIPSYCSEAVLDCAFYNRSHWKMRAILSTSVSDQFDYYATQLSKLLALPPEEVRKNAFTPHRAQVQAQISPDPIPLQLGRYQPSLHHHSIVLVLVPHVMVKNAVPGSSSNLILQHATRLAMVGLRPVVVTVGFDDISDGWTMRDSVTYIQGHRLWTADTWASVIGTYPADLVLAYGGIEEGLDLPQDMRLRTVPLSVEGLFDPDGILADFAPAERWALSVDAEQSEKGGQAVPADALSEALFVPPDLHRDEVPSPLSAFVLLNNARDFVPLVTVITAIPSVSFTVLTALRHRGIEKNLRTIAPGLLPAEAWDRAQLLIQFSTRPSVLAAECVTWIERSGRLIAAPQTSSDSTLATHLRYVVTPSDPSGWIRAIQAEVGQLELRHRLLLSD